MQKGVVTIITIKVTRTTKCTFCIELNRATKKVTLFRSILLVYFLISGEWDLISSVAERTINYAGLFIEMCDIMKCIRVILLTSYSLTIDISKAGMFTENVTGVTSVSIRLAETHLFFL